MPFCTKCRYEMGPVDPKCPKCGKKVDVINLWFNAKYTYFSDKTLPVEFKLKNLSDIKLKDVEISFNTPKLGCTETKILPPLMPGKEEVTRFDNDFPKGKSGIFTATVRASIRYRKREYIFSDTIDFHVCSDLQSVINLNTKISGKRVIGNYIDISIKDAIQNGAINSVDALIGEQWTAKDRWAKISLKYQDAPYQLTARPGRKRTTKLMLVNGKDPRERFYIFAKPELILGRPGDEKPDIYTLCYPYDPEDGNDFSNHISRRHGAVIISDGEIRFRNLASGYSLGSVVDNRKLSTDEEITIDKDLSVNCALVLALDFRVHKQRKKEPGIISTDDWQNIAGIHDLREEADDELDDIYEEEGICCLSISRRSLQNKYIRDKEKYLVVGRYAEIGSGKRCPFRIDHRSVEEKHARVYFYNGYFYLHILDDGLDSTKVDGERFNEGDLIPLKPGQEITIGKTEWLAKKVKWDYCLEGEKQEQ